MPCAGDLSPPVADERDIWSNVQFTGHIAYLVRNASVREAAERKAAKRETAEREAEELEGAEREAEEQVSTWSRKVIKALGSFAG